MLTIGIILCGDKDYEIPKEIWREEIDKITNRLSEKEEEWKLKFIYEKTLENTPLLKRMYEEGNTIEEGKIEFMPIVTDWLRYKDNAGWKRDQKMIENGNYCLCFLPSQDKLQSTPAKYILPKARKEKLIVREIYPVETKIERKEIKPGSLTLSI